jgi:hypothetical protein
MAFSNGLMEGSSGDDSKKRELEQMKNIQDQITSLIDQQNTLNAYYLKQRRKLNADYEMDSYRVNDMILTPSGNFSTDPMDTILAMRRPQDLMGNSGNAPIQVIINNLAGVEVQRETKTEDDKQQIIFTLRKMVKNDIATGEYDGAMDAMRNRRRGREVMS